MPITQNRMMTVIRSAHFLLTELDNITILAKSSAIGQTLANADSVAARTPDPIAREMISELSLKLGQLYYGIIEMDVPPDIRDNIIIERTHFKKYSKSNEHLANYKRVKRAEQLEMRASLEQVPQFFNLEQTEPAVPSFIKAEAKPATPKLATPKLTIEEKIALRKAREAAGEIEPEVFDNRPRALTPPGEDTPLSVTEPEGREAVPSEPKLASPLALWVLEPPAAKSPATAKPHDTEIVSTSVPPLDELYAQPLTPGQDPL